MREIRRAPRRDDRLHAARTGAVSVRRLFDQLWLTGFDGAAGLGVRQIATLARLPGELDFTAGANDPDSRGRAAERAEAGHTGGIESRIERPGRRQSLAR